MFIIRSKALDLADKSVDVLEVVKPLSCLSWRSATLKKQPRLCVKRAPENSNNATHDPVSRRASSLGLGSAQHTKRVVSLAACSESQDAQTCIQQRVIKRKLDDFLSALGRGRRQGKVGGNANNDVHCREFQSVARTAKALNQQETAALIQENNELFAKCLQYEKVEEELIYRVTFSSLEKALRV
ncbi:hypothetical protein RND81_01G102600 [Saponaria officinalis]|uniref:Uncharacterized protein n=1 Tax=Saponaria officinalis TaxID=3572 RepID=A0AAW1NDA3_SAPOF